MQVLSPLDVRRAAPARQGSPAPAHAMLRTQRKHAHLHKLECTADVDARRQLLRRADCGPRKEQGCLGIEGEGAEAQVRAILV